MRFFRRSKSKESEQKESSGKRECCDSFSQRRFPSKRAEKAAAKEAKDLEEVQRLLDEARSRLKDNT